MGFQWDDSRSSPIEDLCTWQTNIAAAVGSSNARASGRDQPVSSTITAEQFEREYAERCNVTVDELRAKGRVVVICNCDYEKCQGFGSIPREIATDSDLGYKIVLP